MGRNRLIFGGTFDPPHRAHLELPSAAAQAVGADVIVYVPAAQNPLKSAGDTSSAAHRLRMLELALAGRDDVIISTVELDRGGTSFFVDTLEALITGGHARDGDHWWFLIGADNMLTFKRWRSWERILELAQPVVLVRPPHDRASLETALHRTYPPDEAAWWADRIVEAPTIEASATDVRERLARGEPVDDVVPDRVAAYARDHGLYADVG